MSIRGSLRSACFSPRLPSTYFHSNPQFPSSFQNITSCFFFLTGNLKPKMVSQGVTRQLVKAANMDKMLLFLRFLSLFRFNSIWFHLNEKPAAVCSKDSTFSLSTSFHPATIRSTSIPPNYLLFTSIMSVIGVKVSSRLSKVDTWCKKTDITW